MAVKISIRPNGPYLVEGEVELLDVNGNKIDTSAKGARFALCRCGASVT
jgi:CDGSH-type Zn-finger protein